MEEVLLLARIRQGDRQAFDALLRPLISPLSDFAAALTGSRTGGEDVVQDVLLNVWSSHASWQPTISARAYLFGAVRNRALNEARNALRRRDRASPEDIESIASSSDTSERVETEEFAARVRLAIEALPERRRLMYRLSRIYGLTYDEIAVAAGVSLNTVRTQMSLALAHMRVELADYL